MDSHPLSTIIGYEFKNKTLLEEALTHPSHLGLSQNNKNSYEKLEFLGDSVLSLVITRFLFQNFPNDTEGTLTKKRAALINGQILFQIGNKINMIEHIHMVKNKTALKETETMRIVENSLEALIGALYLDGGFPTCEQFVLQHWNDLLTQDVKLDPKTELQEWSQRRKLGSPKYSLINQAGKAHTPIFTISVLVNEMPQFTASSSSKKTAKAEAAKLMLQFIKENHESKN